MDKQEKELLFVHIPKTGGVSVNSSGLVPKGRHRSIVDPWTGKILPEFQGKYSFAIVRNPYDRFLSAYTYLMKGGQEHPVDLKYQSILQSYANLDAVLDDLRYLKRKILHFEDQVYFIANHGGKILVDRVIRFENLKEELVALHPGFENLPHKNASPREAKQPPLTIEQKQKIAKAYRRDFKLLDYTV
jgi:hypothetical protein